MDRLSAVKTAYGGYLFRSRLEARWAVFFDTLGIKYKYEHEMHAVGNYPAVNYIPDFYLPELNLTIEIKAKAPTERELYKATSYAYEIDNVLILIGSPGGYRGWLLTYPNGPITKDSRIYIRKGYSFCECPKCGLVDISQCEVPDRCNPSVNIESTCFILDNFDNMDDEIPDGRVAFSIRIASQNASRYVFTDEKMGAYQNKTNTSGGAPTEKMLSYAKYLARRHDVDIDDDDIEYWCYDDVSNFISEMKELDDNDDDY